MEIIAYLLVLAAGSVAAQSDNTNQIIPILSYSNENNYDGSYKYSYGTANGITVEEEGALRNPGVEGEEVQTARGRYSYTAPDGQVITVTWYADETGFHADVQNTPQNAQNTPQTAPATQTGYSEQTVQEGLDDKLSSVLTLAGPMFRGK